MGGEAVPSRQLLASLALLALKYCFDELLTMQIARLSAAIAQSQGEGSAPDCLSHVSHPSIPSDCLSPGLGILDRLKCPGEPNGASTACSVLLCLDFCFCSSAIRRQRPKVEYSDAAWV